MSDKILFNENNLTPTIEHIKQYVDEQVGNIPSDYMQSQLDGKLDKSGGIVSGVINYPDGSYLIIGHHNDGAELILSSKNEANIGGNFYLRASDGTNIKELLGKKDGTLSWDSKPISCIESSGGDYIRYTNGLQICWGNVLLSFSNSSSTNATITFGAPFKDPYYAINGGSAGGNQAYGFEVQFGHNSNTQCNVLAYRGTAITATNRELYYIAIGYWK